MQHWRNESNRGKLKYLRKTVLVQLCPPQNPHGQTWDGTSVYTVRGSSTVWLVSNIYSLNFRLKHCCLFGQAYIQYFNEYWKCHRSSQHQIQPNKRNTLSAVLSPCTVPQSVVLHWLSCTCDRFTHFTTQTVFHMHQPVSLFSPRS